jgi:hypothetical protein
MIKIEFDPAKLTGDLKTEWDEWEKRATAATQEAIDEWEKWFVDPNRPPNTTFRHEFRNDIWSELKHFLRTHVSHGKCAYCETSLTQFVGDAEHYRPKGRVSVKQNEKMIKINVCVDDSGQEVIHPGYFWLAYDWQNLLPSCERCNKGEGKLDQFPVSAKHAFGKKLKRADLQALKQVPYKSTVRPGWYYLRSKDLDALEQPLLLHPYFDDPDQHLRFGVCGIVAATDNNSRGLATIEILGLSEDGLRSLRQSQQELSEVRWLRGYQGPKPFQQAVEDGRRAVEGYIKGQEPYSAAARDFLKERYPTIGL